MPRISSSLAKVPGTSSPLFERCRMVREEEKPTAPARIASRTIFAISAISSGVALALCAPRSPMT